MTVPAAKEFLYRELQQTTVHAPRHSLRREESEQNITLHFQHTLPDSLAVTLDQGVREYLAAPDFERTCKLEFDRSAGWDRVAAEQWIEQHLGLRRLGESRVAGWVAPDDPGTFRGG